MQPLVPVLGAAAATWYSSVTQANDITVTATAESGPRALAHGNGGTLSARATVIFGNAETV